MTTSRLIYIIAGGGVAILMVVSFILPSLVGLLQTKPNDHPVDKDGPGAFHEPMDSTSHVSEGTSLSYTTTPPTSGPHYDAPSAWGLYDDVRLATDERITHNLEHTGVVISYNLSDPVTVVDLKNTLIEWPEYPCYFVLRPYEKIDRGTIALSAWTKLDGPFPVPAGPLDQATKTRVIDFLAAYAGNPTRSNAPEFFPCNPQPRNQRTPATVPGQTTPAAVTPTAPAATPAAGGATPTP